MNLIILEGIGMLNSAPAGCFFYSNTQAASTGRKEFKVALDKVENNFKEHPFHFYYDPNLKKKS